jgi:ElaA protein
MSDRSTARENADGTRSPRWRWCRVDALTVFELERIYAARQQVFAIEQQCIYLDVDGCDELAYHLAAWSEGQRLPIAYARLVDPGVKYPEPSIGRLLTTPAARRAGLGRELVRRMVVGCAAAWPGRGIRISAQAHLQTFYEAAGFSAVGTPYAEDGIPHVEMIRAARA